MIRDTGNWRCILWSMLYSKNLVVARQILVGFTFIFKGSVKIAGGGDMKFREEVKRYSISGFIWKVISVGMFMFSKTLSTTSLN